MESIYAGVPYLVYKLVIALELSHVLNIKILKIKIKLRFTLKVGYIGVS